VSEQGFAVREAGEGDAVALAGLAHDLGYEVTAEQVRSRLPASSAAALSADDSSGGVPPGAVFVAEDAGGVLLGWIQVQSRTILVDSFAELGGLIVRADQRCRGVGAALLAEVEAWACRNDIDHIRIRSNVRRPDAAAFYEARGFTREKTQNVFLKEIGLR
jgi:GNAT superfamily N-acetyltransferase